MKIFNYIVPSCINFLRHWLIPITFYNPKLLKQNFRSYITGLITPIGSKRVDVNDRMDRFVFWEYDLFGWNSNLKTSSVGCHGMPRVREEASSIWTSFTPDSIEVSSVQLLCDLERENFEFANISITWCLICVNFSVVMTTFAISERLEDFICMLKTLSQGKERIKYRMWLYWENMSLLVRGMIPP